jgi:hypothetical protein
MTQIYVPLLEEGTDVWRPTSAEHITEDVYRITGEAPEDERWKFSCGQLVRCRQQKLSGGDSLVAYESATI